LAGPAPRGRTARGRRRRGLGPEIEAIEWREGEATALPFPDESFDVVYCEQGLQFFGDRARALVELRRVVASDGRLALSVCRSLDRVPGYAALSEALERHAGPEAGAMMRSPFALGDGEALGALAAGAGFRDVRLRLAVVPVRYPSAEQLLWQEAASSPLAGPLGRLDGEARRALVAAVAEAMRPYVDDDGVMIPLEYHVVLARR
jgi:SAM-dependent methyltransferase